MNLLSNSNKDIIIKTIVDKLKKDHVPQKIILFGSYAYGNPTSENDIDMLVIKETTENPIKRFSRHHLAHFSWVCPMDKGDASNKN